MTETDAQKKREALTNRYDQLQAEKTKLDTRIEELNVELVKMQGEYRLLEEFFPEKKAEDSIPADKPEEAEVTDGK